MSSVATQADSPAPAWEQKPVAVLAIDLTFPKALGPEAPRYEPWTVVSRWERTIAEKVHGFGGILLQRGLSLLTAAFGIPRTLDQMPQRAVQAALAIQRLIAEAGRSPDGEPCPELRLVVHLGEVLIDVRTSPATGQLLAVGDTLSLPVRLLGLAAPGEILVSPQAGRVVEGWFELQERALPPGARNGDQAIAYVVTGLRPRRVPLAMHGGYPLSRFVGRVPELTVLRERLAQAERGRGQVVGIVGEPGVGKSRLLFEFQQRLIGSQVTCLEGRCLAYGSIIPYLPVLDLLKAYCHIEGHDDSQQIRDKITGKLLTLDEAFGPTLPAFLALLDVPVEDPQWQALDPPQRRQRTLDAIKHLLLRESQVQPLLVVFEDFHWLDSETQAFLDSLLESLPSARILLVVSYRPEYQHGWGGKSIYTQLRLHPLPPERAGELLQFLLGDDAGLQPLKSFLLDQTEGNPFFLEESVLTLVETKALIGERGAYRLAKALATIQVPATVQAVLAARIDRLPAEERRLLQAAAGIGKDVPFALLQAIAELPGVALQVGLTHLQDAEFLYETRLLPERDFTFKHALTHEVAYGSLPQERRRALHARIVDAIERLYAGRLAEQVERLAHHTFRGELWDKAVTYLRQAGAKAAARSANREAVACFEQALAALAHRPGSCEAREQAIDLRFDLRNALMPLGELGRMLDYLCEAEALAEALGDQPRLGQVSYYMGQYFWMMGEQDRAVESSLRALALADALGDFALQVVANYMLGGAYHAKGEYRRAVEHYRRNVVALQGELIRERFGMIGLASVHCRTYLVWSLAELGAFVEGSALAVEGMHIAAEANHPWSLIMMSSGVGLLYLRKGDLHEAVPVLERGLGLCQVADIPFWSPRIASVLGSVYALSGRMAEALLLLEQAVEQGNFMQLKVHHALWIAGLGEVYLLAGHMEDAAERALQALALSRACGERGNEAWALRLMGEIAAHRDPPMLEQAEERFQQAMALAEELGMRPLLAHCHLGLGTLYLKIGQLELARPELSAAIELFRAMEMMFWLSRAEAELGMLG